MFPLLDERAQKVREMMLHAWTGYKNYSWGQNEVRELYWNDTF